MGAVLWVLGGATSREGCGETGATSHLQQRLWQNGLESAPCSA